MSGVAGLWAAFALTLDKFAVLTNPDTQLGCNFSLLVQCGKNLQSWQGSVFFGVPNPVWGDIGWGVVLAIAMSLVAGAQFQRWFWICANVGIAGALGLCIWLMSQSIFVLGTLCPWCMVTWAASILAFWTLTFHNLKEGVWGEWGRRVGAAIYTWSPLAAVLSYVVIAIIAQFRLDVISYL